MENHKISKNKKELNADIEITDQKPKLYKSIQNNFNF